MLLLSHFFFPILIVRLFFSVEKSGEINDLKVKWLVSFEDSHYTSGRFTLHIWNMIDIFPCQNGGTNCLCSWRVNIISVQSCHFTSRLFLLEQEKIGPNQVEKWWLKWKPSWSSEGCILSIDSLHIRNHSYCISCCNAIHNFDYILWGCLWLRV